jgi:hypothetical protein
LELGSAEGLALTVLALGPVDLNVTITQCATSLITYQPPNSLGQASVNIGVTITTTTFGNPPELRGNDTSDWIFHLVQQGGPWEVDCIDIVTKYYTQHC